MNDNEMNVKKIVMVRPSTGSQIVLEFRHPLTTPEQFEEAIRGLPGFEIFRVLEIG